MSRWVIKESNKIFDLDICERITFVIGDSGSGKTYLSNLLLDYTKNGGLSESDVGISMYVTDPPDYEKQKVPNNKIIVCKDDTDVIKITRAKNKIIILDRYDIYSDEAKKKIDKVMRRYDNAWIIFSRYNNIPNYGYSLRSMVTLEHKKDKSGNIIFYFKQRY